MNPAWAQVQLEENEQAIMLAESFRIAQCLGFKGDYKSYETKLNDIINEPEKQK